jgi:molybdopterin/thiamine biosynthesis adenylyltransferase
MSERYARHADIPGWDQSRLADAQVVVAGIGALGSEVARQLAQAGVGRLILCDGDTVAESNLSRGALFHPGDIGRPKVDAAAEALRRLCPDTITDPRRAWLSCGVGLAELRDATLVISCLDSRGARIQLTMRCALCGAGLLDGGTNSWGGEVRVYPAGGACFGCGMTPAERAARDDQVSCTGVGPTAPGASVAVSALIASWLTADALRMIFGLKVRPGTLRVDAARGDVHQLEHRRDPGCPLHGSIPAGLIEQSPLTCDATVAQLLREVRPDEAVLGWTEIPGPDGSISIRLSDGAPAAPLRSLGVAPREILRVMSRRTGHADRYIELAAAPLGGEAA